MSIYRRAAKRDDNELEIVRVFESRGCNVQRLSGKGLPDLLIGFLGRTHLVEVKRDNETLNKDQQAWHDNWKGERPLIVRTEAHARKAILTWMMQMS